MNLNKLILAFPQLILTRQKTGAYHLFHRDG